MFILESECLKMVKQILVSVLLFMAVVPVQANTAIPGPLIWYASSDVTSFNQWIIATMTMCCLIEGFCFKYSQCFKSPFLRSLEANLASFFLGLPLTVIYFLLVSLIPGAETNGSQYALSYASWWFVPTILSIFCEYYYLKLRYGRKDHSFRKRVFLPLILGNIVTNIFILLYRIAAAFGYLPISKLIS
jgi:hypothetical protein